MRCIFAFAALLIAVAVASPGWAQDAEPAPDEVERRFDEDELFETRETRESEETVQGAGQGRFRRVDEKPLEQMSREEARRAGFVFGDQAEEESRASATFLAATAGLLIHGIGHWYVGEQRTAVMLLAAEGVSVALMGSAFLWRWLSDGSPASEVYAGPALYAGLGLFAMTYVLDVLGASQSTGIGMSPNTRRTRGISVQADYHYLDLEGYSTSTLQLLSAGTTLDFGWGYFGARTDQDVSLDTSLYGLTFGARPWRGRGLHDFVFAEADAAMLSFGGIGRYQRLSGELRAGVSFGLGRWISHLRHVAVGASIGYGRHWYALPTPAGRDLETATSVSYIPVETFLHFNLAERLNARLAYEHRYGQFLQTARPGLGVASVEFLYRSTDRLDLVVRAKMGGGFGLSGGLRLWLWE
jgi:hypothetical protein